jgi:TonB family protein
MGLCPRGATPVDPGLPLMRTLALTKVMASLLLCLACSSVQAEPNAAPPVKMDDVLYKVGPRYPRNLQRARIGGAGLFKMTIDFNTGKVTNVSIVKSTGQDGLDREAVLALRQWRFKPGKLRQATIPITFQATGTVELPPGSKLELGR